MGDFALDLRRPGHHQIGDARAAGAFEGLGNFVQGAAGGHDVVDEQHVGVAHGGLHGEGVAQIAAACIELELLLWRRVACAREDVGAHFEAVRGGKSAGDFVGLIKAALALAFKGQWHGNDERVVHKLRRYALRQEASKSTRQREAATGFQCQHHGVDGRGVVRTRERGIEGGRLTQALPTKICGRWRQRQRTLTAARHGARKVLLSASVAKRMALLQAAGGAEGCCEGHSHVLREALKVLSEGHRGIINAINAVPTLRVMSIQSRPIPAPDLLTVRRQFDARAARFAQHDVLVREIERRLVERLDPIRFVPTRIVDVGCGAGSSRAALLQRYAQAQWLGVDFSLPMLRGAATPVCAQAHALPLPEGSVDLLFSNLMLHWHPDPPAVFAEWLRVLKVGGLLLFSCFGPDTLKELRAVCRAHLPQARPLPFIDMHDLGDMLVAAGFELPVMDVEHLTLTYPDAQSLLREVRALGGNPRADRAQVLPGTTAAHAVLRALDAQRGADGRMALSFEVTFGHAWKPEPAAASHDHNTVSLESLRASLPSMRRT